MRNLFCSTLALLFLGPSWSAPGQEPGSKPAATTTSATPRNITIDDYFQIRDVSQPELSPDGQWVAYSSRTKILKEDIFFLMIRRPPTSTRFPFTTLCPKLAE